MAKHAKLSPSAAHTWMTCHAAIPLSERHPVKDSSSSYAQTGTAIHAVAEQMLSNGGLLHTDFIGKIVEEVTIDKKMAEMANEFVTYVRSRIDDDMVAMYEKRVYLASTAECYGTGDVILMDPVAGSIEVIDLKTGAGVFVNHKKNPQLMIYAIAAYDTFGGSMFDIKTFKATVMQPPLNNVGTYEFDLKEVREFRREITRSQEEIERLRGKPEFDLTDFNPSEKACKFCRAKHVCPALAQVAFDTAAVDFKQVKKYPDDALAKKYAILPLLKIFSSMVENEVMQRLLDNKPVRGYKLAHGRSSRAFNDIDKVKELLVNEGVPVDEIMTPQKLRTVKQIEDVLKELEIDIEDFNDYVDTKDGNPTVVEEDSHKGAYDKNAEAANDFKNAR